MDRLNTKHIMPILEALVPARGVVDRLNTVHITAILEDLVLARGNWWIDLILCILRLSWRTWC